MSSHPPIDPKLEQAAVTDESLITAHEKAAGGKPDTDAHYRMLPLALLFIFSGLIFFAGTYLNRYSGHFHGNIFDERQLPTTGQVVAVKIDPVVLGKKQYALACITCHMPNGQGLPGVYPPLAGSEWVDGGEERLISIVVHGLKGPVTVKGTTYSAAAMPAFGQVAGGGYNWTDEKIAAVLTYIRQEWGNTGAAITTERVTEIRTKEEGRKEWTEAELLKLP
ncbi:MAG: cytochrome c [Opitutaceae bacterium]|nr:cytochrome c [Opitutaceae bacterium]